MVLVVASKVFVEIVILLMHMSQFEMLGAGAEYLVVEFFAGSARVARLARAAGIPTCALDKNFDDADNRTRANAMEMNCAAGFLLLACMADCYCYHSRCQVSASR